MSTNVLRELLRFAQIREAECAYVVQKIRGNDLMFGALVVLQV